MRILIAEDDERIVLHLQRSLERLGATVVGQTGRGEECLSLIEQHAPDLVLMDIRLDRSLDGVQVAAEIQQKFAIPVIYLAAHADPATIQRVKNSGAYGFIVKPFPAELLQATLELALDGCQREARLLSLARFPDEHPYPVMRITHDGIVRYANRSSAPLIETWGCAPGQKIPAEWTGWLNETIQGCKVQVELPCGERVFSCDWTPIPGERYTNLYAFDITERHRLEADLHKREERFRLIAEHAQDVIQCLKLAGPDGPAKVEYVSPSIETLTGYTPAEIEALQEAGISINQRIIHPDDIARLREQITDPADVYKPLITRIVRKDGSIRWVEHRNSPEFDDQGRMRGINIISRDVSERVQMEERLLESESRLRAVIENLPVVVSVVDRAGTFLMSEGKGLAPLGLKPGEVVGLSAFKLFENTPKVVEIIHLALQGQTCDATAQLRGRLYQTHYAPILNDDGEVTEAIGVSSDVTDLFIADQARREGEERFRMLAEAGFEGLAITRGTQIQLVNRQFTEMARGSSDEIVGREIFDFVAPESRQMVQKRVQAGQLDPYECMALRLDGTTFPIEIQLRSIPYEGETARLSAVRDITQRKAAEASLREAQEQLNLALHAARMGVWKYDFLTRHMAGDGEVHAILQGIPTPFDEPFEVIENYIHPDDREVVTAFFQEVLDDPSLLYDQEHRVIWPDGSLHTVAVRGKVSHDQDGRSDCMTGVTWDITERRAIEEELRHLNLELEQRVNQRTAQLQTALRELEAFSYSVSHDLRAPLRSMDGFSRILEEDYGSVLDAQGANYLQRIREASRHMAQLIDGLLNLSRYTRANINIDVVDLSAIAREIALELDQADSTRTVDWVIPPGIRGNGDSQLLRVVLTNLFGNAWKFTSRTPYARIEFGQECKAGRQVFYVRDNGAGFNMAYAEKLFTAFQRLHSRDEFEGSGIGLATVQRIISRHGGEVWAEGEVGIGATFYFTLP